MKSKCKTRDKVCDLMKNDGTLTNSERDKAEVLNDFFVSVFRSVICVSTFVYRSVDL